MPLFNLPPAPGEPARAGFVIQKVPVTFDTAVRTGGDYGVVETSPNLTEVQGLAFATIVTWGTPGAASHDKARGWNCIDGGIDRTEARRRARRSGSPSRRRFSRRRRRVRGRCRAPSRSIPGENRTTRSWRR